MATTKPTLSPTEGDEVAEGVHNAAVFIQKHYLAFGAGIFLILVALLALNSMENRKARISSELNSAMTVHLGQLAEIERSTDVAQRLEAAKKLTASLDTLIAQYPGNPLAVQALFLKGRALYETDQFEPAQAAYQSFIAQAPDDEAASRGDIALGYAYENQSFLVADQKTQVALLNNAYNSYQKAVQRSPGTYLHYYGLMSAARVLEALHRNDEAMRRYQQVVDARTSPISVIDDTKTDPDGGAVGNPVEVSEIEYLRRQVRKMQSTIGFQETARLRLASLKGEALQPKTEKPAVASPSAPAPTP